MITKHVRKGGDSNVAWCTDPIPSHIPIYDTFDDAFEDGGIRKDVCKGCLLVLKNALDALIERQEKQ